MNDHEIQKLISREVIGSISDKTIQSIIRAIVFNPKNEINWDQALQVTYEYMPELTIE